MGRTYAGALGSLAFSLVLLRGLIHAGGASGTVRQALIALFGFALVGYVLGQLADWIVWDSVRSQVEAQLAAQESARVSAAAGAAAKS